MATIKQKKAFKKAVENGGNVSRAMIESDYSPATAKTPQKLTTSKGWQELLDKHLPDKLLAEKHRELLNKKEVVTKNNVTTGEVDTIETGEIDVTAVTKGLDMAYKLKGRYANEDGGNKTLVLIVSGESAKRYNVKPNGLTEDSSTWSS